MNSDQFIIFKKGEFPDTSQSKPFNQAVPELLREWGLNKDLQLYACDDKVTYTYEHRAGLSAAYTAHLVATGQGKFMQMRDSTGQARPVNDLPKELATLKDMKSGGVFYDPENIWLVLPPDLDPDFDANLDGFSKMFDDSIKTLPPTPELEQVAQGTGSGPLPAAAPNPYPTELTDDADIDLFPGLSGNKLLDATVEFTSNASPALMASIGAVAGVVAYKAMGIKGIVGLILLYMALKRVMTMGSKVIQNQRLDLVARGMQEGVPVGKDGRIDPEFLQALRLYPAGDHEMASRELGVDVMRRSWEHNPIAIAPDIEIKSYKDETRQIVDGDTFYGTSGCHYRLVGVDTPEMQPKDGGPPQAGAQSAWDRVRELIPEGAPLRVEVVGNQTDKFGRIMVYAYANDAAGNEYCLNQKLLEEGLARVTTFEPYHPKMQEFVQAHLTAIEQKQGLWNKRFNPAISPRPRFLSVSTQTQPDPAGGDSTTFQMT
jgi:endonuclease YncB( thermonuclease family)